MVRPRLTHGEQHGSALSESHCAGWFPRKPTLSEFPHEPSADQRRRLSTQVSQRQLASLPAAQTPRAEQHGSRDRMSQGAVALHGTATFASASAAALASASALALASAAALVLASASAFALAATFPEEQSQSPTKLHGHHPWSVGGPHGLQSASVASCAWLVL